MGFRDGSIPLLRKGVLPNSPPDTGGVAAPSRKRREATEAAQTGWSGLPECFGMRPLEEVPFSTTPSAPLKEASRLLLDVASTPPVSGGSCQPPIPFGKTPKNGGE